MITPNWSKINILIWVLQPSRLGKKSSVQLLSSSGIECTQVAFLEMSQDFPWLSRNREKEARAFHYCKNRNTCFTGKDQYIDERQWMFWYLIGALIKLWIQSFKSRIGGTSQTSRLLKIKLLTGHNLRSPSNCLSILYCNACIFMFRQNWTELYLIYALLHITLIFFTISLAIETIYITIFNI